MKSKIDINQRNKRTANGRQMFSLGEDFLLRKLVDQYGPDWKLISQKISGRTARQCRERYKNYVAPNLLNKPWTQEEDMILAQLVACIGQKWSMISSYFKNRSEVNVKNRWSSLTKSHTNNKLHQNQFIISSQEKQQNNQTQTKALTPKTKAAIMSPIDSLVSMQDQYILKPTEEFIEAPDFEFW